MQDAVAPIKLGLLDAKQGFIKDGITYKVRHIGPWGIPSWGAAGTGAGGPGAA